MPIYAILFIALLAMSDTAFATVYQCKSAGSSTSFSDKPCETDSVAATANSPTSTASADRNKPKNVYTKDMEAMASPDAATQACFTYVNTTAHYPDPSSTKLLSSSRKTVAVKHVGARQMLTIETASKNEAGMYVGKQTSQCLLMGDGLTINTKPFELL